jgi:membrane protease subunit HflC
MKSFGLFIFIGIFILLSNSLFTVNEREMAVLFQFGAVQRTDFKPGIHLKMPFVQNVRKYDRRLLTLDSEPERYLTAERKDVIVDFFVKWRIIDVERFYTATQGQEEQGNARLTPIVREALRKAFNERKLQELVSGRIGVIEQVAKSTDEAARDLGMSVIDVRIIRIDLPDEVSGSVFQRMRAERQKVANDLRAKGQEASETIRSDADRQRQVLLANAGRDASKVRGDGEAQAAQIYAKAYQTDAEFYAFYRSLEAYRESFKNKDGVLVLDPKSEFFDYFGKGVKSQ